MPGPMQLNIIGTEWIWIVLVAVIFLFGSKKVPEVARSLGKAIGEFQKGRAEIEKEIKSATDNVKDTNEEIKSATNGITSSSSPTADSNPTSSPSRSGTPIKVEGPVKNEREKIEKAAKDLGLDPKGKSDKDLKEEIKRTLG